VKAAEPQPAARLVEASRSYVTAVEEVVALRPTTLTMRGGETLAVLGPSGSGKTTLLHLLGLLLTPSSGRVEVCGLDSGAASERDRDAVRRRSIGFVFQEPLLVGHLPVLDNVRLWRPDVTRERCDELLGALGLEQLAGRLPSQLSGGQQQRVAVARALAPSPTLVLADEPTASLDDDTAQAVIDMLRRHTQAGGAVVIASHDVRAIEAGDRRVRLDHGRLAVEAVP
jgi:putative ABC transport system ATP-binding protein